MRVFLIHGMGRTPRSLLPLAGDLEKAGFRTAVFGYQVRRESFEDIAQGFLRFVQNNLRDAETSDGEYAIVGHSLGNIITRHISGALPPGWTRFVMMAPPNRPAYLAQRLRNRLLFQGLTGSAGQNLGDPSFYAELPIPSVATLVFAGDLGAWGRLLPRGERASDGVVSVEETRLEGADHRIVPAVHTLIMNHPRVRAEILQFLGAGR